MAITWKKIAWEDDVITKSIINAKGDLIVGSADNTPSILSVGANGRILTADSGQSLGIKWADFPQDFFQKASMYRSTVQSIPNTTWTKVQIDAVSFDPYSICDTSNHRIKPTKAGYYLIIGYGTIDLANYGKVFLVAVYKNGSVSFYGTDMAISSAIIGFTRSIASNIVYINGSSDYLEIWCYHDSGASRNLQAGSENTFLSVVGPL